MTIKRPTGWLLIWGQAKYYYENTELLAKAKPKMKFSKAEGLSQSLPRIKFSLKRNEVQFMEVTRAEGSIIKDVSDHPEMERWDRGIGKKSGI